MAEYQIEIAGPRNEYIFFPPVPAVVNHRNGLRGRWDFGKTAHRDKSEGWIKEIAFSVPVIPGMVIAVNDSLMMGSVYDPLSLPDGAVILQKVNDIRKQYEGAGFEPQQAWPTVKQKLDINGLKEWLYWMRRILDRGDAIPVPGSATMPDLETIRARPGRRKADPFYTGQATAKSADNSANFGTEGYGIYPWADEVPVDPKGKAKEPAST